MRLSGVSVVYSQYRLLSSGEDVLALRDVSIDVRPGEKLGVIGPNGAGKSTLTRVMAGVLNPNVGSVDNEGRSTALLSLNAGFDSELTGARNIVMHGMLSGLPHKEAEARVAPVAEMSGLGDAIYRRVSTYSSGMRSRLCFSTAINLDPDVLLLDEVFSVGDQEFREKSREIMLDRFREDKTIVFVTHNVNMVKRICNRALWLDGGTVVAHGPVDEVIEQYRRTVGGAK